MRYTVEIEGRQIDVEVRGEQVVVDGETLAARLVDIPGTPVRLVVIGDDVHQVLAQRREGRGRYVVSVAGHEFEVEALDERMRAIRELAGDPGPTGPAPLVAPMPGLVVRVAVSAGDAVAAGQGIVVMEAMKMENELRAPAGGRVRAVRVAPGQAVEKGAVLVELE